nr:hypothetical protein [Occallatibacter savannae]
MIILLSPVFLWKPSCRERFQWLSAQIVEFVAAFPFRSNQACALEDFEVLRDALPRDADLMPHEQARADLEERLAIPVA